jgi:micrococcal nuclease
MTYKFPPEDDEPSGDLRDSEYAAKPDQADEHSDDLADRLYGPSQRDMDHSWEGYETGDPQSRRGPGPSIWKYVVVGVSLLFLAGLALGTVGPLFGRSRIVESVPRNQPELVAASVLRVIDARTIVVRLDGGEQTVRLIGVESPLFGDPWYDYAQLASETWIEGNDVLLESDQRDVDDQGRLLRYVYFDDVMINALLIFNGLGKFESDHPDVRYDSLLADLEQQARAAESGMWGPPLRLPDPDGASNNTEVSLRSVFDARLLTS